MDDNDNYILLDADTLRPLPLNDRYVILEKSKYVILPKERLYRWIWGVILALWALALPAIFFAIWMGWLKG